MLNKAPPLALLKHYLIYDEKTGIFTWRNKAARNIIIGAIAGSMSHGYITIRLNKIRYFAHRLAWLYVHSEWPEMLDHINGIRHDNKILNLRKSSYSLNAQNKHAALPNNKSGYLGVYYRKTSKRYVSYIILKKKQHWLGTYDSAEEAYQAYLVAKRRMHPACTI